MSKLKEYFQAWASLKSEEIHIKIKIEWFDLALAVILVLWAYKELFK